MHIDFSGLFHQSTKDRSGKGTVKIPLDPSTWPAHWHALEYKSYPRLPKIILSEAKVTGELKESIRQRQSRRGFSGAPVRADAISSLLKYSCGIIRNDSDGYHRAQPSGGSRYPIEVYPVVFSGNEHIQSGVYHYNIRDHALDVLWQRDFKKEEVGNLFTYPWAQNASFALFFTGVFERNQRKYGERGYRQILIETGAIVQNVYLLAAALDLQCCAIDGVKEPAIEKLLDIDGFSESVICSMILG